MRRNNTASPRVNNAGQIACPHCDTYIAPEDAEAHRFGAKGTLYACVGEIARLRPAQRQAALTQHELWANRLWD